MNHRTQKFELVRRIELWNLDVDDLLIELRFKPGSLYGAFFFASFPATNYQNNQQVGHGYC